MRNWLCLLLLIMAASTLHAQYAPSIASGRPGQSIAPFTVGARVAQVQTGFNFGGAQTEPFASQYIGNETVLRYGLTKRFELSALLNYASQRIGGLPTRFNGLAAFHFGGRFHIFTGKGLLPSVAFQYRLKLRAVSEAYRTDATASNVLLVTQQSLTDKISLVTNNGLDWNGFGPKPSYFYTLNLSRSLGDRWAVFIENYGNVSGGDLDAYFDVGLAFLATDNLQIDGYGGSGMNEGLGEYFMSLGLSWRLRHRKLFD